MLPKPYYENELGRLYHGDCLEILPHLEPVDLVLTDPPYIVHAGYGGGCFGKRESLVNTGGFTDQGVDYSFLDNFTSWFVFCSLNQLSKLLEVAKNCCTNFNLITWCKPNPLPTCCNKYLPDKEYIVHGYGSNRLFGGYSEKSSFIFHPCGNNKTEHPNEKPIPVLTRLVKLGSLENEIICDPFFGSGSTAVACERLKRKWIGIEISEEYCAIAVKRIEDERKQTKAVLMKTFVIAIFVAWVAWMIIDAVHFINKGGKP